MTGSTPTIADLLSRSRAAHEAYVLASRKHETRIAAAHLQDAAKLRADAEALDPTYTDPAWDEPGRFHDTHAALLAFYGRLGAY